ncbi:MAG: toprim domain-containing protein [Patescibacteria group bacterium]
MIPESIKYFIERFSKLPSLGPRLATRLAFYLASADKNDLDALEKAVGNLKKINRCGQCFFLSDGKDLCGICSNPKRDKSVIAIVEKETDLMSLEQTGNFKGHYLVLGELTERGSLEVAQKLRLQTLKDKIKNSGKAKEIIVALSPSTFGDFVGGLIKQEFKDLSEKITRLGRGIPTGGEIEFADEETLSQALERRN